MTRPVFGQDVEPTTVKWVVVGWHPRCLHVRFISGGHLDSDDFAPGLVYGTLPLEEARARLIDCVTCSPTFEEIELFGDPS